jgi:hypothetical protein
MNVLAFLPGLIWNIVALTWVIDLEKKGCQCTADWRRQYLKYWYMFSLALTVFIVATKRAPLPLMIFSGAAGLVAFGALATMLWEIERRKCDCAQDWREKALLFMTAVSIVAGVVGGVLGARAGLR